MQQISGFVQNATLFCPPQKTENCAEISNPVCINRLEKISLICEKWHEICRYYYFVRYNYGGFVYQSKFDTI